MIRTFEAVVDAKGTVRLLETVTLSQERRALVTILDEPPAILGMTQEATGEQTPDETALLSEAALQDWARPEEEAAWSHLRI